MTKEVPVIKNIFDIVNNINTSKEVLERSVLEEFGNVYMINRAMSNNFDTVFFSDEASGMKSLTPWVQYLFYFYSVTKKKRYGKWEKKLEEVDSIKYIREFYGVSYKKALEYMEILTPDQIGDIVQSFSKGGKSGRVGKQK